jgi:thiol-disulfide isomerase/thioredoxin
MINKWTIWSMGALILWGGCKQNTGGEGQNPNTPAATTGFAIDGMVNGMKEGTVYLKKVQDKDLVAIDSATLKDGHFSFKGKVAEPEFHFLMFGDNPNRLKFVLENAPMVIKSDIDSLDKPAISGSSTQRLMDAFNASLVTYTDKMDEAAAAYEAAELKKDAKGMAAADALYEQTGKEYTAAVAAWVREHKSSILSPYIANRMLSAELPLSDLEAIANGLDASVANSKYALQFKEQINILKKVDIGQPAPDFAQNDPKGKSHTLAEFRGKYLLVDFWASWCGPCREANPDIVKLYQQYKGKKFDILGVSLDTKADKWQEAITKDKLVWTQVSDLKGWANAAAEMYGVKAIPHSVLLAPDGTIVAKGLEPNELKVKLAELLK